MSDRVPPPLSPAAQQLLRAFRDDESPTELVRRRGLVSVHARIDQEPAAEGGRFYAKAVAVTLMLAAAVLLALKIVGAGVTALAGQAREPAMEAPYQGGGTAEGGQAVERTPVVTPPRRPAPPRVPPTVEVEAPPEAPSLAEPEPTPAVPVARARATAPSAAPSTVEDLQAELMLIKRAREARQAGRHADGLAALAEHARRFPQGTLADERRVMKAELLCASGRTKDARALVRRFLEQRAGSALAGRMGGVCSEP